MDRLSATPRGHTGIREPYTKGDVLAYLDVCQSHVQEKTRPLRLDEESGFSWFSLSKRELQI